MLSNKKEIENIVADIRKLSDVPVDSIVQMQSGNVIRVLSNQIPYRIKYNDGIEAVIEGNRKVLILKLEKTKVFTWKAI